MTFFNKDMITKLKKLNSSSFEFGKFGKDLYFIHEDDIKTDLIDNENDFFDFLLKYNNSFTSDIGYSFCKFFETNSIYPKYIHMRQLSLALINLMFEFPDVVDWKLDYVQICKSNSTISGIVVLGDGKNFAIDFYDTYTPMYMNMGELNKYVSFSLNPKVKNKKEFISILYKWYKKHFNVDKPIYFTHFQGLNYILRSLKSTFPSFIVIEKENGRFNKKEFEDEFREIKRKKHGMLSLRVCLFDGEFI